MPAGSVLCARLLEGLAAADHLWACLACKAGAPTPDKPPGTSDSGGAVEPPRADGGTKPEPPPHGKRGCTLAGDDAPGTLAALVMLACGAAARRRRARTR
ncbi:MAG: hypothetical protein U0168_11230 [Nannocystaceae bacterium]